MIYQIKLQDTQAGGTTVVHVPEISFRYLGITDHIKL
jgi:hypothetical protein